jgi:hypothetical protein
MIWGTDYFAAFQFGQLMQCVPEPLTFFIDLLMDTMPPLNNARHELFAQSLLQGKSASEAYIDAGFKGDRGNASRLAASPGRSGTHR